MDFTKIKKEKSISPKRYLRFIRMGKNRQQKASLTVEATFAAPLLLFLCYLLWQLFLLLLFELSVGRSVLVCMEQYGTYGYLERKMFGEEVGSLGGILYPFLLSGLPESEHVKTCEVRIGSEPDGAVSVEISYEFLCLSPLLLKHRIPVCQVFRFFPYLGIYDKDLQETDGEMAEDIVYLTEHGTVYHESKICTYLRPDVRKVLLTGISRERNASGGRYTECLRCRQTDAGEIVYITTYGDSYHTRLTCTAICRTIITKPRSEVSDRKACSKCGMTERKKQ